MGAEASLLEDCVLDEPILNADNQNPWNVYPAVKNDGTNLTVFAYDKDTGGYGNVLKNAGKVSLFK